jgi:hypothetical protein
MARFSRSTSRSGLSAEKPKRKKPMLGACRYGLSRSTAHRRLPAKNTLTADDARAVEVAYRAALSTSREPQWLEAAGPVLPNVSDQPVPDFQRNNEAPFKNTNDLPMIRNVKPLQKAVRKRNKVHLTFVGSQPCLICQRTPCDAHHLKFAQPRSLGRKVSDEFSVPLCRDHHHELHRHGNEAAWWANVKIAPMEVARELWGATLLRAECSVPRGQIDQSREEVTSTAK